MKFISYADRDLAAIGLADRLAGALKSALLTHDSASLVVPGGTTPGPVFDVLCAADLPWSRVHVMPSDERWVARDDPRANEGLIRKRLLTARAASASYVTFLGTTAEPEDAVGDIAARVAPWLPISVLLLGMGEDMHTASLFPGCAGLDAALGPDAPPVIALRPDAAPEPRISLTARVLDAAMSKHLVIFGAGKRAALERAASLPPEDAPIQAVLRDMTVHWAE